MRAAELGVDIDNLRVFSPDTIQETFQLIEKIVDGLTDFGKPFMIVVDSVTAVPTDWQSQKGLTNQKPGELAQAIKMGMKMITSKVAKKKVLLLLVNHAHETMAMYGKATTSSGGHAIKFFSSNRIEFKNTKTLKTEDGKERLGQEIKVNIEKLKVAKLRFPDFKINLMVDGGFATEYSLLEAMISVGMVKHPKGSKVYTLESGTEFAKLEWPQVVADNGGLDALYEHFIKEACVRGHMIPWGNQENG